MAALESSVLSPGSTAACSLLPFMVETDWTTHPLSSKWVGGEQEHLRHVAWTLTRTLASPTGLALRKENELNLLAI